MHTRHEFALFTSYKVREKVSGLKVWDGNCLLLKYVLSVLFYAFSTIERMVMLIIMFLMTALSLLLAADSAGETCTTLSSSLIEEASAEFQRIPQNSSLPFPLILTPASNADSSLTTAALFEWMRSYSSELDGKLEAHQAILFRGFNLSSAMDFEAFVEASGYGEMEYKGGAAVRKVVSSRVLTSNESPSTEVIPFHHELAQTASPPTHVFFFSLLPALSGGETPILSSLELFDRLERELPSFTEALEREGVQYIRTM